MKNLNIIEKIIGSLTLIAAIIIQSLILFEHDAEWYRNFYYVLSVISIVGLFCIGYCLFEILKFKKFMICGIIFPCIGLNFSIQQYKFAIEHIDPSEGISGMNYFVLEPFIICILLFIIVFLCHYFWIKRNSVGK